jgi:glycosyltransferase involved in cell wall biosynthesis
MMLVGTLFKAKLRINWYQTLLGQILLDRGLITPNISMRYQMWRKRFVYHFCTHLIPVSEYASLDLQKYYAVPSSKCHVFYNSTGDTSIGQEKQLGKTKIVRCFARLDPCKGIDVLVRAWKSVINDVPEAILEIYGKGSPEDVILLEEYKDYSETIKWHSAVSPTEVKQLMETANCTVLPSRMDNCPLVIIESLSTGTPVVASKVGGIPELIRDQRDGFLVEPENPLELADQLVYLLSHPEICFKMGKNAREHFLANFEVKQVARKQADWLEEEMRQRHIL